MMQGIGSYARSRLVLPPEAYKLRRQWLEGGWDLGDPSKIDKEIQQHLGRPRKDDKIHPMSRPKGTDTYSRG